MNASRWVPAVLETVADEPQETGASTHLDQKARDRITLTVKAHQVPGIVLDHEEASEGNFAAASQQIEGDLVVAVSSRSSSLKSEAPSSAQRGMGPPK